MIFVSENQVIRVHIGMRQQPSPQLLKQLFRQGQFDIIVKNARHFRQKNPANPEVLTILGIVFSEKNQLASARKCFESLVALQPNSPQAHYNLGITHRKNGDQAEALASFEKAVSLKPDYAEAYNGQSGVLHDMNKIDEAKNAALNAIRYNPDHYEANLNLALCLIAEGEFDEAKNTCFKLMKINPDSVEPYYHFSRIHRFSSIDDNMKTVLRLLENTRDVKTIVLGNYALGKGFSDIRDFDKAFHHWKDANAAFRKQIGYHPDENTRIFDSINYWADRPVHPGREYLTEKKPFFIIGMPRSGTSLVEQILSGHSAVHAAGELDFWGKFMRRNGYEKNSIRKSTLHEIRKGYDEVLRQTETDKHIITDKMPLNFRWVGLIRSLYPDAPIIHLKRNPVAVCFSNYRNLFQSHAMRYTNDLIDIGLYYLQYDALMTRWYQEYGDSIIPVDYEALTENPRPEIEALLSSLGLEWQESCLKIEDNKRTVNTTSDTQIRSKIYTKSSEEWQRYEKHLGPLIETLEPILKRDGWI